MNEPFKIKLKKKTSVSFSEEVSTLSIDETTPQLPSKTTIKKVKKKKVKKRKYFTLKKCSNFYELLDKIRMRTFTQAKRITFRHSDGLKWFPKIVPYGHKWHGRARGGEEKMAVGEVLLKSLKVLVHFRKTILIFMKMVKEETSYNELQLKKFKIEMKFIINKIVKKLLKKLQKIITKNPDLIDESLRTEATEMINKLENSPNFELKDHQKSKYYFDIMDYMDRLKQILPAILKHICLGEEISPPMSSYIKIISNDVPTSSKTLKTNEKSEQLHNSGKCTSDIMQLTCCFRLALLKDMKFWHRERKLERHLHINYIIRSVMRQQ